MNKNIALRGIFFLGMPGRKGFPFRATNKYIWYSLCANVYTNRKSDNIIPQSVNLSECISKINEEIVRWRGILFSDYQRWLAEINTGSELHYV